MKNYGADTEVEIGQDIDELIASALQHSYSLIVWNDDVNTFENVIITLMEVCGHTFHQAEQSAMIIHTKGKCNVKNGDLEELELMLDKVTSRGITATIEEND